jgi:glycosyltransferase involved in cell wall biosynthesis
MGTGTRLKILDALAAQKPIVSTRIGAAGLDLVHGKHLLIADTAADFASATTRLLGNPNLCAALSRDGRAYARKQYDWNSVLGRVDDAYAMLKSEQGGLQSYD